MGAIFAPIPSAIRYDIYGNITNISLSQEDKIFAYNTLEYTPQNKLTYIRARYYDSSNGTFISKDTYLGNIYKPNTTNRYAYCSGDPVNYMDLNGHMVVMDAGIGGGGASSKHITKPSTSNTKTNTNKNTNTGNKNQPTGGSSGNSSGGSSYVAPPPPPNPVEKYIKPSIFDKLKATVSSAIDNVKSLFTSNKTI